ncbi:MAG: hypothetical protein J6Y29_05760 [Clostridiales bacterium]|nr:hypothetical protein [Clostridiales bacterium]
MKRNEENIKKAAAGMLWLGVWEIKIILWVFKIITLFAVGAVLVPETLPIIVQFVCIVGLTSIIGKGTDMMPISEEV